MTVMTILRAVRRRALLSLVAGAGVLIAAGSVQGSPLLLENFDDVTTLAGSGWTLTNNSSPVGSTDWFQGNDGIFAAQGGAPAAYIAANFNNADVGGDISNWLISPNLTFGDGDTIAFYTRTELQAPFADRLELRLSTNGASANVGATASSVGDFSTLLLTINPSLTLSYPDSWTLFVATLSGLGGPTSGRFAFRYDVPDTNTNGDYIGIDTVSVNEASAAPEVPEPATWTLLGMGLAGLALHRRRAGNRA